MREPFPEEPRFLLFQFRFQTAGTYSAPPPHQSKVLGREGRGEGNLCSESTLSVRLQELTVREVLDMCEQFGKGPLVHDLERLLPRMSNLTTNDLMDMTPGELEMLWEQVKEVNAAFFRIAGALGFGRVLEAFRAQLRSDLMEAALNGNSSVR